MPSIYPLTFIISLSFWNSHYTYVGTLDGFAQASELCLFFFILFFMLFRLHNLYCLILNSADSFFCQLKSFAESSIGHLFQLYLSAS